MNYERNRGWYWAQSFEDGTTDLYAGPYHSQKYAWTKRRSVANMPKGAKIVFLRADQAQSAIDRRKEHANGKV